MIGDPICAIESSALITEGSSSKCSAVNKLGRALSSFLRPSASSAFRRVILLIRFSGSSCTAAINPSKERSLRQAASLVAAIYLSTGLDRSSGFVCNKSNAFSSGIPSNKMSNLSDTTITGST